MPKVDWFAAPFICAAKAPDAAFMVRAVTELEGVNVCAPVHVGTMAWDSAWVPSLRMNVVAVPLTAESPMLPEGFAPTAVLTAVPAT